MRNLIPSLLIIVCSLGYSQTIDCDRFKIFDLQDTIVNPDFVGVYFKMTTDMDISDYNSGYTDLYFVDQSLDTLNIYGTWGYWLPSSTNIPNDTLEYVFEYKQGITTFPTDFNGHLVARNPDYEIPFNFSAMGTQSTFPPEIHLDIFPNPTQTGIQIINNSKQPLTLVELYNPMGQLILSKANDLNEIDLTAFDNGTYFLKAYLDDRKVIVKKIIKN